MITGSGTHTQLTELIIYTRDIDTDKMTRSEEEWNNVIHSETNRNEPLPLNIQRALLRKRYRKTEKFGAAK
jgi:hypothetical protein